jgi:nucleoside-triphosphatase THEP1
VENLELTCKSLKKELADLLDAEKKKLRIKHACIDPILSKLVQLSEGVGINHENFNSLHNNHDDCISSV